MRLFMLLAALGLLTTGCTSDRGSSNDDGGDGGSSFSFGGNGGVWLLALGSASDGGGAATCDENFNEADCPDLPDPPDPDPEWTGEVDNDASPELFFVQILEGGGDDAFLIVDDEVYPGEISSNTMTFSWTHSVSSDTASEHDSGYRYEFSTSSSTRTVYEFDRDGSSLTGRRIDTTTSELNVSETDEWDGNDVGYGWGLIDNDVDVELTGNTTNLDDEDECAGGTCEVTITSELAVEYSLTGSLTDYDDETYDLLRQVGQTAGN